MKILVVDDDEIAQEIAHAVLKSDGHEVTLAEDGEKAYEILQQKDIQIVISDWDMPKLDGIELCKRLRLTSSLSYTYFIMVTSFNSKADLLVGLSAGANDFITKPFEPAELLLRVRNAEIILAHQTNSMVLDSFAELAEIKDTETGNHLKRVRNYAKLLAEELMKDSTISQHLPPRFPELIDQTSVLHDIGKVGIPDSILLKPGNLNDQEWQTMKKHTVIGAERFSAILQKYPGREFLVMARDIAWSHHEWVDGTGYPRGLKGEEIPLCARIVALADVYDALTLKRVYKEAFPHEVARGIILNENGKHFDPQIVQAFLNLESEFLEIRSRYL